MTCAQLDQLLDDYLDDRLDAAVRGDLESHLAGCGNCRAAEERLRTVLEGARRLPRSIDPPRNLWPEIAARLPAREAPAVAGRITWRRWLPLAAAAVLLIAVTAVVTRQLSRRPPVIAAAPTPAPTAGAGFASDRDYVLAAEDLERVLREGRDRLAPATVEIIERNLALIDAAIAEAREALRADPANADLRALLWGAHRQKLDLLDRATRLTRS
ncbi:MAG TPA: zf-HC2 domain-containing protein [Gemmatimonadales bacterium]|nr:zf-HC2 domain-containing protein [Gemmatimonadales bacterium]